MKRLILALLALMLASCGGAADLALPLAEDQVTVLFFYTDN